MKHRAFFGIDLLDLAAAGLGYGLLNSPNASAPKAILAVAILGLVYGVTRTLLKL